MADDKPLIVGTNEHTLQVVNESETERRNLKVNGFGELIVTTSASAAGSELPKGTITAASSGDNTVYTPPAGMKVRLYYFSYSAGANVSGVLVGLKFGANSVFDQQYLITPGQPFARNIKAGNSYVEGEVDEPLIVELSAAQTVYVNFEKEDI